MYKFEELINYVSDINKQKLNVEQKRIESKQNKIELKCQEIKNKIKEILSNADIKEQIKDGYIDKKEKDVIRFSGHIGVANEIYNLMYTLSLDDFEFLFKDNDYYKALTEIYGCRQYSFDIVKQCPEFVEWCTKNGFVYSYKKFSISDSDPRFYINSKIKAI